MASIHEDIIGGRGYGYGGDGLGGGLGLIALLALLGRGGFGGFGERGREIGVDGLNNLQGAIDTNAILSKLATLEGAIPLAESQVQLALAGVQNNLQQNINAVELEVANGFCTTNTNIERSSWQVSNTVKDEGEKVRALIQAIDKANDSRLITSQANEITELRHESNRERDRHGTEITLIQNQNQNQMQFQQQNQVLSALSNALFEVGQIARATNSNVIVGNTGASTTGAQTASPTNVRA